MFTASLDTGRGQDLLGAGSSSVSHKWWHSRVSILVHSTGKCFWLLWSFLPHPPLCWAKPRPCPITSVGCSCRFLGSLPSWQTCWLFLRDRRVTGSWGEVLGLIQTLNAWPCWLPGQSCWRPQGQLPCCLDPLCMRGLAAEKAGVTPWVPPINCWGSEQREQSSGTLPTSSISLPSVSSWKLQICLLPFFFSVTDYLLVNFHDEVWPDLTFPTIQWELQRLWKYFLSQVFLPLSATNLFHDLVLQS